MYDSNDIASRIKAVAKERGVSVRQMLADIGLGFNTMSNMKNGSTPKSENLAKIADYLDCSVDYLLGRTNDIHGAADTFDPQLTEKDEKDIAKQLDDILSGMNRDALMFDGEPLDDETKELLRASLDSTLRMAKLAAKKKFTPKKYRK